MALYFWARNVLTFMRVGLVPVKVGFPCLFALSIKSLHDFKDNLLEVCMFYLAFGLVSVIFGTFDISGYGASGPSSTILCFPTAPQRGMMVRSSVSVAQLCIKFRGPTFSRYAGSFGKECQ